ncbi:MAG: HAD-IC family P-type ATPase [Clostridia bacterium]|nr:HAD-IC family P-type ATPase [Clostridia bacterium]
MKKNRDFDVRTKSALRIVTEHLFTLFNLINIILALALIFCGSFKNLLFMGTVVTNFAIGVFWELKAKRTLEKLRLVTQDLVKVRRNGKTEKISRSELEAGDLVELEAGDGIVCDGTVTEGRASVDESSLTGEEEAVEKLPGDALLSGTTMRSGFVVMRAEKIGADCYAAGITRAMKGDGAKKSVMLASLNRVIFIISVFIVPVGALMLLGQLKASGRDLAAAVVPTAASLVGMIPDGLMLLTSTVLAIGVVRLAKKNVLVQELYSIESLARTDTVCLDKTGTLTTGDMQVEEIRAWSEDFEEMLKKFVSASSDGGATLRALRARFGGDKIGPDAFLPFDSARKYSAVKVGDDSLILGAPEIVGALGREQKDFVEEAAGRTRVICLWRGGFDENGKISDPVPLGAVTLSDRLRSGINEALAYFYSQNVDIRIISGDNVKTVSRIASLAGVKNSDNAVDVSKLSDEELALEADKTTVFARVTPERKKLIIRALKKAGHTVAMTGDGVNDVQAMRESDCAVAPVSGTAAARNSASLVMLDDDFCSLPHVVAQGRQCIGNVERSGSVFLTKTVLSALLTLAALVFGFVYPFDPIKLTLIGVCGIGMPSFLLGLEPSRDRIKGDFFKNIVAHAFPAGLSSALSVLCVLYLSRFTGATGSALNGAVVLVSYLCVLSVLCGVMRPFNRYRAAVAALSVTSFVLAFFILGGVFGVALPDAVTLACCAGSAAVCQAVSKGAFRLWGMIYERLSGSKRR